MFFEFSFVTLNFYFCSVFFNQIVIWSGNSSSKSHLDLNYDFAQWFDSYSNFNLKSCLRRFSLNYFQSTKYYWIYYYNSNSLSQRLWSLGFTHWRLYHWNWNSWFLHLEIHHWRSISILKDKTICLLSSWFRWYHC